ncbi:hypothetical protein EB118_24405 [bacterium]|nr:hypothetical protein [bacterium]
MLGVHMDNTFHIAPTSELADEVAAEIRAINPEIFVAIRGEMFDGKEGIYGVFELHPDDHPSRYSWSYMLAKNWLAEYEEKNH